MTEDIDTQEIRKIVDEMSTIILSEDLAKALHSLDQDKKLLAKAKADPKAFLKAQGLTVPPKTEVKMVVRRRPNLPVSVVGSRVPRFILEFCFTHCLEIFPNHPLNNWACRTFCNTIFVF